MSERRNIDKTAPEVVDFITNNPTDRSDATPERRLPKGDPHGGRWTTDGTSGAGGGNKGRAFRQGSVVTIIQPDGTTETREGGSRAWRNNNPGNIEAGRRASDLGAIGTDGRFAIFPDEATGTAAQDVLLKGRYSSMTVDQAVAAWAPEKDGNDTATYQAFVRKVAGLAGDQQVGNLTPAERQRLMAAQRRMEGWKPGSATRR